MDDDYLKLYEAMNDRIGDLAISYRVLNEHHTKLEVKFAKLESQVSTTASIIKWLISPVALASFVLQVLRIWNVF